MTEIISHDAMSLFWGLNGLNHKPVSPFPPLSSFYLPSHQDDSSRESYFKLEETIAHGPLIFAPRVDAVAQRSNIAPENNW